MDVKKKTYVHNEDIQAKLDKKLGPEYISKRIGFGSSRVAYIEGWRVINLANQIFGYNGWSTEVKSVTIDFLDEKQGKFSIGCTAIIRVTLTNGTHREDIGYGTVENERRKSAAFERAKKSAVTDALKRSLRGFGNALGNCLYDKDFLSKIDKVKFDPPDFDEGNLFRPSDEISENSRSNTIDTENSVPNKRRQLVKVGNNPSIGKIEDVVPLQNPTSTMLSTINGQATNQTSSLSGPFKTIESNSNIVGPGNEVEHEDLLDDSFMMSDDFQDDDLINMGNRSVQTNKFAAPNLNNNNMNAPVTFVTAKGATSLQNNNEISKANMFDPKYQAQSIKHTIDQSRSKHVPATMLDDNVQSSSRDSVYERFAAKGKQVETITPTTSTTTPPSPPPADLIVNQDKSIASAESSVRSDTNTEPIQPSEPVATRYAPPSEVVHPNSHVPLNNVARIARREVGRPKVNPLHLRKPSS